MGSADCSALEHSPFRASAWRLNCCAHWPRSSAPLRLREPRLGLLDAAKTTAIVAAVDEVIEGWAGR